MDAQNDDASALPWPTWLSRLDVDVQRVVDTLARPKVASERYSGPLFFGPYEIFSQIGRGGVAVVLRVRHVHPAFAERPTALKLLQQTSDEKADARVLQLFRREAGVHSLIVHPNIVQTYESGVEGSRPFLVMEFVRGGDMDHLLSRLRAKGQRLPAALAVYVIREVLQGLSFAHGLRDLTDHPLGLVHRDVNPANVFLSYDGEVKLGDFGVASIVMNKRRHDAEVAGKVGYFAPEHLAGEAMDARADVFAAAATLFEMLSGVRLFQADDDEALLALNERAELPDIAAALPPSVRSLANVLKKALHRHPRERHEGAQAFCDALQPYTMAPAPARLALRALVQHYFENELERERALEHAIRRRPSAAERYREHLGRRPRVELELESRQAHAAVSGLLDELGYDSLGRVASRRIEKPEGTFLTASAVAAGATCAPSQSILPPTEHASSACSVIALAIDNPPTAADVQRLATARKRQAQASLVVTAPGFGLAAAELAAQADAVDLWAQPFRIGRVRRSLDEAVSRRLASAGVDDVAETSPHLFGRAILAVGARAQASLARARLPAADRVTAVASATEALSVCDRASFDLVVLDGEAVRDLPGFVAQFRARKAMGPVPTVACHLRPKTDVPALPRLAVLAQGHDLHEAMAAAQRKFGPGQSRSYPRYATKLSVQLRVAGRLIPAHTIDVSRRGLLLASPFLPSVGTRLGLRIGLPATANSAAAEVLVSARAQRADVRHAAQTDGPFASAKLGVALGRFAGGTEAAWVGYVCSLPPPPPEGLLERAARWLSASP